MQNSCCRQSLLPRTLRALPNRGSLALVVDSFGSFVVSTTEPTYTNTDQNTTPPQRLPSILLSFVKAFYPRIPNSSSPPASDGYYTLPKKCLFVIKLPNIKSYTSPIIARKLLPTTCRDIINNKYYQHQRDSQLCDLYIFIYYTNNTHYQCDLQLQHKQHNYVHISVYPSGPHKQYKGECNHHRLADLSTQPSKVSSCHSCLHNHIYQPYTAHRPTIDRTTTNMANLRQVPLTCSGHTRPVVHLDFSDITDCGYFLISACKGAYSIYPTYRIISSLYISNKTKLAE